MEVTRREFKSLKLPAFDITLAIFAVKKRYHNEYHGSLLQIEFSTSALENLVV